MRSVPPVIRVALFAGFAIALGAIGTAVAANPDHVTQLLTTRQCPSCDLTDASTEQCTSKGQTSPAPISRTRPVRRRICGRESRRRAFSPAPTPSNSRPDRGDGRRSLGRRNGRPDDLPERRSRSFLQLSETSEERP